MEIVPCSEIEKDAQQKIAIASVNPTQILNSTLQQSAIVKRRVQDLQCTLYISDVGGHAARIPRVFASPRFWPSIYFLTFPLHKGLNTKCPVEYQHPDGRSIIPFEASCTTKEILLSSLASISSTRSYIKLEDGKPVTPKCFSLPPQG